MLCKVYYENGDYKKALDYIEQAISQEVTSEMEYCSAFRHDKAKCLNKLNDINAKSVMDTAIKMQPNEKLKKEWEKEMLNW